MKKLFTFILISIIAICSCFAFVGCGEGGGTYDSDNFLTLEEATALGTPNKIVKEPITLKVFVPKSDTNPSYSTMRMFQVLSQETNINFKFTEAQSDQYANLRTLTWQDSASADFPDLFLFNNQVSELVEFSAEGLFTPFNDNEYIKDDIEIGSLIDNYMPTLKGLMAENFGLDTPKTAEEILTLKDGKIYSVPSVNDVPRDLTTKYYVNQAWINDLNSRYSEFEIEKAVRDADGKIKKDQNTGNEVTEKIKHNGKLPNAGDIKTIEELDFVLRVFKTYNASRQEDNDGNGLTIPVITDNLNDFRNYVLSAFGYVSNTIEINQEGDGFVYVPQEEAYRKYLQIMSDWYKDGILYNATAFSAEASLIRSKGSSGLVGSFCGAAAYLIVGENYGEQGQDWYKTAGPFTSEFYKGEPIQYSRPQINVDGAAIPSSTPYAREIARLLDIMYSDLGTSLSAFGQENVDWEWKNAEKTEWAKKIPSNWTKTEEDYRATLTPNVGLGVALYNSYDFVGKEVAAKSGEKCITDMLNEVAERYTPYLKEPVPSYIKLNSVEDYDEEAYIGVTLMAKVKEYEFEFISTDGEKDPYIDSDWNGYVQDIKNFNSQGWLDIYNRAITGELADGAGCANTPSPAGFIIFISGLVGALAVYIVVKKCKK